jgi:hypothetical protein
MYQVKGPCSQTATLNVTSTSPQGYHGEWHGEWSVTITCGIPAETAPDGSSLTPLLADLRQYALSQKTDNIGQIVDVRVSDDPKNADNLTGNNEIWVTIAYPVSKEDEAKGYSIHYRHIAIGAFDYWADVCGHPWQELNPEGGSGRINAKETILRHFMGAEIDNYLKWSENN